MSRDEIILKIRELAPVVTQVTETSDMGYEFSAVVPDGVIYAEVGMLLEYSGGDWPPFKWANKTDKEFSRLMRNFLLKPTWRVTSWSELTDEEISGWLETAAGTPFKQYIPRP